MYLEKERKVIAYLKELFPLKSLIRFGAFLLVTVTVMLYAAPVEVPHVFKYGDVVSSARINANFKALEDRINAVVESVPVGTIVPFAAEVVDNPGIPDEPKSGWLLCDGSELNPSDPKYTELFKTIGTAWGGDGANGFRLPDLRGYFLRGVDKGAGIDSDAESRTFKYVGGNSGDVAGSYEDEAIKAHQHSFVDRYHYVSTGLEDAPGGSGRKYAYSSINDSKVSDEFGGSETRPKNAAINYIIKY